MNLLEHYIKEIKNTKTKTVDENEYIIAIMIVNCYGVVEETTSIFTPAKWEEAKKRGYYLA